MNNNRRDALVLGGDSRLDVRPLRFRAAAGGPWPTLIQRAGLVLMAWTIVGIIQALPLLIAGFDSFSVIDKVLDAWAWALLTPVILLLDRKFSSTKQSVARLAILWFICAIPFSIGHAYLSAVVSYPVKGITWNPFRDKSYLVFYVLGSWQTFFAIVGVLLASRYYNRFLMSDLKLERVEKTLIEARLNALRLQLEPHFLFNAMNAISSEVSANPKLARDMIEDLGVLLRQSLDCKDRNEITLAQELTLLERYLSIQRVRFGERLEIRMEIEPATLNTMVPPMLLQPLVENAIRHGIERRVSGGTIAVSATAVGEQLQIHVLDNGVGVPRNWRMENATGLGLRVTRERLEALYPECSEDAFTIRRRETGGTEVAIRIPLHSGESEFS
jgi:two-component system, LytTR family, sensor kinase